MVDWKDGAKKPNYLRAVANTRLAGRQIGMFIGGLEDKFGTNLAQHTHIIGFSLGAHVAGYAGMFLAEKHAAGYDSRGTVDHV